MVKVVTAIRDRPLIVLPIWKIIYQEYLKKNWRIRICETASESAGKQANINIHDVKFWTCSACGGEETGVAFWLPPSLCGTVSQFTMFCPFNIIYVYI